MDAIVWDMDGTLFDSEPLWGIATYELSERLGKRLTPQLRETTVGGSFPNTYAVCCRHAGRPVIAAERDAAYAWMVERVTGLFETHLEVIDGVKTLLTDCVAAGIPLGLATNTPRKIADGAIAAVGKDLFTVTVCGDEVPAGKPAPDIYREATRRLGVAPQRTLVFEDSVTGMIAGRDAGCAVVCVAETPTDIPAGVTDISDLTDDQVRGPWALAGRSPQQLGEWFDTITG